MNYTKKLLDALNPISRLGKKDYSFYLPLACSLVICLISEIYAYEIAKNPNIVGVYIILVNVVSLIYFSFRNGVRGGIIASIIPIFYYFYIIYSRHYIGTQLTSGIKTTIMLGLLYVFLASVIGWLKQTIDTLIEREAKARLLAEEGQLRLQIIMKQLPVGVLLVDKDKGAVTGNKQLETILGRKPVKYLQFDENHSSNYAYHSDEPLKVKEFPIVRAFHHGETVESIEMEYVRDDKKRIFLRVNAAPIKNKNNQIIAAVSTFYDITQEKEQEQRKDDFLNMASHELKTPITSMKLYLDLLLARMQLGDDEKAIEMVQNVKKQTKKLQNLVNELLDISRIQTGKLSLDKEAFDINPLVVETLELLQTTTYKHKLVFKPKDAIFVFADRFRVYQILTNLLTNAIKYSEEEQEIIINVKQEKERAIISVQDFGIGIASEQKTKIFDKLYQVADRKEKTFPGLGMGLYISKEIVKRHKGAIWVESSKGKGSTFYFSLPLKK